MSRNPRLALYGEGDLDVAGEVSAPVRPGTILADDQIGPAHILTRRSLSASAGIPSEAVHFVRPLNVPSGRQHRGSQLHDRSTLRRLIAWPSSEKAPDLVIVLVDQDGKQDRRRAVNDAVAGSPIPAVIGIAIEEFEAWLLADEQCVRSVAGSDAHAQALGDPPEQHSPTKAKQLLHQCLSTGGRELHAARRQIAAQCVLDRLADRCGAFNLFRQDLAKAWKLVASRQS